ncbi:hypothetical protein AUC71_07740 [Methyloceanibacter marginalis]|uniref:Uncharacterized protein n=1 Tax=Methyloceanibacter marginalis TaxID=1774971 RepID=A0A1E3WDB1_9HYPH|nr:hypothetical protein [Methyloceanibacter marginalis]ODS03788.1 hypothetical protein AUC71_07740 [Methyloceanibacter marginalis]
MSPTLPGPALEKMRALEQAASDADALVASSTSSLRALLSERHDPATDEARFEELDAEIKAGEVRQQRRMARRNATKQLAIQIRAWLTGLPRNVELRLVPPMKVEDEDLGDVAGGLEDLRRDLKRLQTELREVRTAPKTTDELKAEAKAFVDGLAKAGAPVMDGGVPRFGQPTADYGTDVTQQKILGLIAWLAPDRLLARIEGEIDAGAGQDGALASDERQRRVAELERKIAEIELCEEAYVSAGIERGLDVQRRVHASPAAVLSVQVVKRSRKAA